MKRHGSCRARGTAPLRMDGSPVESGAGSLNLDSGRTVMKLGRYLSHLCALGACVLVAAGAWAGELVVDDAVVSESAFRLEDPVGPVEQGRLWFDDLAHRTVLSSYNENDIRLESEANVDTFLNLDGDTSLSPHSFRWYRGRGDDPPLLAAELQADGDMTIAGGLTENSGLDLAESFLRGEELRAGDVVRVSPRDPDTVLRAAGAGNGAVIGVVSSRPGVVLGGAPFTVEALRESWGEDVVASYHAQRATLRSRALEARPRLAARLRAVGGPGLGVVRGTDGEVPSGEPGLDDRAGQELRSELERATLEAFFEERFVPVALAGRVPVRVDASYGAIRPGDPLAASPEPGVAMKARRAGPVLGTALEGREQGEGLLMMLVHRGWQGGAGARLGATLPSHPTTSRPATRAALEEKDAEIAALRRRVGRLERLVGALLERQNDAGEARRAELTEIPADPETR